MGDGAHLGIGAESAMKATLGGEQPSEEEHQTPAQVRERIEKLSLFEGEHLENASYSTATDALAHAFMVLIEEDPTLLEPRFESDGQNGQRRESQSSVLWKAMEERWPNADDWLGGPTGFMVGFALNEAVYALDLKNRFPNPAILTIEVPTQEEIGEIE